MKGWEERGRGEEKRGGGGGEGLLGSAVFSHTALTKASVCSPGLGSQGDALMIGYCLSPQLLCSFSS